MRRIQKSLSAARPKGRPARGSLDRPNRDRRKRPAVGVFRNLLLLATPAFAYAADPSAGKALFEQKCAVCHAAESSERRIGPALKGVKEGHLPSHKNATPNAVLQQIDNGGGGMPVFRELLTKEQKEEIVAYVLTL